VGAFVFFAVGAAVGLAVGAFVFFAVGAAVGLAVGAFVVAVAWLLPAGDVSVEEVMGKNEHELLSAHTELEQVADGLQQLDEVEHP
jgi:hypothetical protein